MSKENKKGSTGSLNQTLGATTVEEAGEEGIGDAELLEHPSYDEMQEKLTATEKQAALLQDQFLRSKADIENIQRRAERDVANAHKYALEKFVLELLPVVDTLERAMASHQNEESGSGSLLDGVSLTLKMFQATLEKFGVESSDPLHEPFNPEVHQAVSVQEGQGVASGSVLSVLQKGYLLNKRLIRPALVVVAK